MLEFQSSLGHAQFVTLVLVLGTQEYVLIHIRSAVKELRTGLTLSPHATSRPPHISKIMSPFNQAVSLGRLDCCLLLSIIHYTELVWHTRRIEK